MEDGQFEHIRKAITGARINTNNKTETDKSEDMRETMSLDAIMKCAIDAKGNRYVFVTDKPVDFLHAEDSVHMLLEVTILEHNEKLDPQLYRNYIWYNKNGKSMLYLQLKKAIYDHYFSVKSCSRH